MDAAPIAIVEMTAPPMMIANPAAARGVSSGRMRNAAGTTTPMAPRIFADSDEANEERGENRIVTKSALRHR